MFIAIFKTIKWHPNQSFAELLRHLLNMIWKPQIQANRIHINSHIQRHSCWQMPTPVSWRAPGPVAVEDPPHSSSALETVDSTIYNAVSKVLSPPTPATKTNKKWEFKWGERSHLGTVWFHLYVVPRIGKSIESENRRAVTFPTERLRVGQGGNKELVFNGYRVSVWGD